MPHAETIVNGEKSSSQFISHLASYPVVSESISTFKSNPYGAKSIEVGTNGYNSLVAPVLPYAQKPYGYVKPYVERADGLADSGLTKVDETFPIVKEDASKIKSTLVDYITYPFKFANESKDYVLSTYNSEYKKCGGNGAVAGGKAVITTSLVVTSDTLAWLSKYLSQTSAHVSDVAAEKLDHAKSEASKKKGEAEKTVKDKVNQ